jgi:FAD/FMN-containing dehydrogenase
MNNPALQSPEALDRMRQAVGPKGWIEDPADMAPYLSEWRGLYKGKAVAVVRPGTTEELAAIVQLAARAGLAIIPQAGNTSLVGGSIPFEHDDRAIVLSVARLNRIREIDARNFTMTVEAGCILKNVQDEAERHDRLFPLSLGAEGTCQIGGNLSSNAGGVMTIRYGNTRDLILGVEVVLPDGRIWDGLRRLRKNNTGYDLKHLFIGGEGTLGVVTAAVVKLFPKPRQVQTAFAAVRDPEAAIDLLGRMRTATGDAVGAFELLPRVLLDFSLKHVPGVVDPLAARHDWYALIDVTAGTADAPLREIVEEALAAAMEEGLVLDAALSDSDARRRQLWFIREAVVEAQNHEGVSIKHDVSVPVSSVAEFMRRATAACEGRMPGIRVCGFGHVGDGNIHFNLSQPVGMAREEVLARWNEMNELVHDIVMELDGSISAEHGVGRMKRDELLRFKSPVEMDLMRAVKRAFDPQNRMNPGKVLWPTEER